MLVGTSFDITGSGVMDGALLVSTGAEEKEGAMVIFGVSFGSDVTGISGVDGICVTCTGAEDTLIGVELGTTGNDVMDGVLLVSIGIGEKDGELEI